VEGVGGVGLGEVRSGGVGSSSEVWGLGKGALGGEGELNSAWC